MELLAFFLLKDRSLCHTPNCFLSRFTVSNCVLDIYNLNVKRRGARKRERKGRKEEALEMREEYKQQPLYNLQLSPTEVSAAIEWLPAACTVSCEWPFCICHHNQQQCRRPSIGLANVGPTVAGMNGAGRRRRRIMGIPRQC